MRGFSVTYEIVTEESAANGEAEESGFVVENETLSACVPRVAHGFSVPRWAGKPEADTWPVGANSRVRWLCFPDYYSTADGDARDESRTLHIPDRVTDASSRRIFRLFGGTTCPA